MPAHGQCPRRKRGFVTRGERHFRGLSLDATTLTDPKPQLAVATGHRGVSLQALQVAYAAYGALAIWAGG